MLLAPSFFLARFSAQAALPTYVGAGAGTATADQAVNLTPALPAGVQTGDLMLCQIGARRGGGGTPITSVTAGWTLVGTAAFSAASWAWVYYKFHDGLESAPSINWAWEQPAGTGELLAARVYAWRGVNPSDPFEDFDVSVPVSGTGPTYPMPAVTTAVPNSIALSYSTYSDDDTACAAATGMTGGTWIETVAEFATSLGFDQTIHAQHAVMAAPGTITGGLVAIAGGDVARVGVAFAIQPAGVSGGGGENATNEWILAELFGATSVVDSVGGANGTYVGNPQKGVPGIVSGSNALALDGWRDYVQINHVSSLAVANGTICGYGQCHTLGWDQTIIQKGTFVIRVTALGRLRVEMGIVIVESGTDFEIDAGKAFFFAVTFGAGGLKLYLRVSGGTLQLEDSDGSTAGLGSNTSTLFFGTDTASEYRRRLHGFLSRISWYNQELIQADLAGLPAPVSADVYNEDRAYWGWGIGQYASGGGAANSTMNQAKNGYMFQAMRSRIN